MEAGKVHQRSLYRPIGGTDADDVSLPEPESVRGLRVQLHPASPDHRGQRIGQLLQPRSVGASAIVQGGRWIRIEIERVVISCTAELGRLVSGKGSPRARKRQGFGLVSPPAPSLQAFGPELFERFTGLA